MRLFGSRVKEEIIPDSVVQETGSQWRPYFFFLFVIIKTDDLRVTFFLILTQSSFNVHFVAEAEERTLFSILGWDVGASLSLPVSSHPHRRLHCWQVYTFEGLYRGRLHWKLWSDCWCRLFFQDNRNQRWHPNQVTVVGYCRTREVSVDYQKLLQKLCRSSINLRHHEEGFFWTLSRLALRSPKTHRTE